MRPQKETKSNKQVTPYASDSFAFAIPFRFPKY